MGAKSRWVYFPIETFGFTNENSYGIGLPTKYTLRRDFIFDEFNFNFNLINFYLRRNFPSPGAAWVKSCQGSIYYLTITILIG